MRTHARRATSARTDQTAVPWSHPRKSWSPRGRWKFTRTRTTPRNPMRIAMNARTRRSDIHPAYDGRYISVSGPFSGPSTLLEAGEREDAAGIAAVVDDERGPGELAEETAVEPSSVCAEVGPVEVRDRRQIVRTHEADARGTPALGGPVEAEGLELPPEAEPLVERDDLQVRVQPHALHAPCVRPIEGGTHERLADALAPPSCVDDDRPDVRDGTPRPDRGEAHPFAP